MIIVSEVKMIVNPNGTHSLYVCKTDLATGNSHWESAMLNYYLPEAQTVIDYAISGKELET